MVLVNQKSIVEVTKNDRKYFFECDQTAPIGEIFDALNEILGHVIQIINSTQTKVEKEQENVIPEQQPQQ